MQEVVEGGANAVSVREARAARDTTRPSSGTKILSWLGTARWWSIWYNGSYGRF